MRIDPEVQQLMDLFNREPAEHGGSPHEAIEAIILNTAESITRRLNPDQPAAQLSDDEINAQGLSAMEFVKPGSTQPAAPDKDVVWNMCKVMHPDPVTLRHLRTQCPEAIAAIAAGYTRRPVDTRPTRSQLYDVWGIDSAVEAEYTSLMNTKAYADCLIEYGYAIPDPAPAAEAAVVKVRLPDDARERIATWLGTFDIDNEQAERMADSLLAALTKATDQAG